MSLTYTRESYESGPLSTTTEYKLSDGTRFVKIVTEAPAADGKVRTSTRVLRADFEGDKEHRSTLRELEAALSNANPTMYLYQPAAMGTVKLDTAGVTGAVRHEEDAPAEEEAPGRFGTPEARKAWLRSFPNTGTEEEAPADEAIDAQFLGFNADKSMSWAVTFASRGIETVRAETRAEAITAATAARAEKIAAGRTDRREELFEEAAAARAVGYVIEPGYEEQAKPLTAKQAAVLTAIRTELGLPTPLVVLPPVEGNPGLSASAPTPSGRFLIEVAPGGFLDRVAVRYEAAGYIGWADLPNSTTASSPEFRLRLESIAAAARHAVRGPDAETIEAGQKYRTYATYKNAEPLARETVDAVFSALDAAGYVGDVYRGVSIDYPSGSVTASFALPNIGGEPTRYLVGMTHDGYLSRLAKHVHTGRMEWDEEAGEDVPEGVWRTVRVHAGDRAGDILRHALRDRPALPRWKNAADAS